MVQKNIVAIGNCVLDFLYEADTITDTQKQLGDKVDLDSFLARLPEYTGALKDVPRPGDAVFLSSEAIAQALERFFKEQGVSLSQSFNDVSVLQPLLGQPEIAAGGSLANTIASIASSQNHGQPLANMKFISVLDEDEAGKTFKDSMPAGTVEGPLYGQSLYVHVIPSNNDRIMIASPSLDKSTDHHDVSEIASQTITDETDIIMVEGFLCSNHHHEKLFDDVLRAVENANQSRLSEGKPPIHLVITASSQPTAEIDVFRQFVENAIQTTDVTIHANTGEFRRLLDNDKDWRVAYNATHGDPFKDIEGKDLEKAKKASSDYRAAKTAANVDTIENIAIPMAERSDYTIRFVVTDGGNTGYVLDNDQYITYEPNPLDKDKIVNTVGAGDAFMAGFWVGQLSDLPIEDSITSGGIFAHAAIMQQEARLSASTHHKGYKGPVALLAENGLLETASQHRRKPLQP